MFYEVWEKKTVYLVPVGTTPPGGGGGQPGYPSHPIYIPGQPEHPWVPPGGGGQPGYPSHPIYWPGQPTHPIVLPPGGGGQPGYPDQGLPPFPSPPIYYPPGGGGQPGYPSHPIYWPGQPTHPWVPPGGGGQPGYPDQGLPPPDWAPVRPDQGLPIAPVRPGGGPMPPTYTELPPDVVPPASPPTDAPDLASPGYWAYILMTSKTTKVGFVQTSIATDPDHTPEPPVKGLPGEWIAVGAQTGTATYAWIPSEKGTSSPPSPPAPAPHGTAGAQMKQPIPPK